MFLSPPQTATSVTVCWKGRPPSQTSDARREHAVAEKTGAFTKSVKRGIETRARAACADKPEQPSPLRAQRNPDAKSRAAYVCADKPGLPLCLHAQRNPDAKSSKHLPNLLII